MEKRLYCTLTLVILALFLSAPSTSQAEIALMDGKLILSGFVKNTTYYRLNGQDREFKKGHGGLSNHDTNFDFSNFSAYLEALYTVKEDQQSTFRIFGGFRTWYEMATSYDDSMSRSMYKDDRRQYQFPQKLDDVITELYTDYTSGPWQLRLGKQIVIWGQLDMSRVADVVNPLDLRWGVPPEARIETPAGLLPLHDDRLVSAALVAVYDDLIRKDRLRMGNARSAVIPPRDPLSNCEF